MVMDQMAPMARILNRYDIFTVLLLWVVQIYSHQHEKWKPYIFCGRNTEIQPADLSFEWIVLSVYRAVPSVQSLICKQFILNPGIILPQTGKASRLPYWWQLNEVFFTRRSTSTIAGCAGVWLRDLNRTFCLFPVKTLPTVLACRVGFSSISWLTSCRHS